MISSIITPVRWYADFYESDRFASGCDICKFELISDKTRLLPFQFRRPKSPYLIDKWFLRNQCEDPAKNILNNNDSLFTIDTGYWTKLHFSFIKGKIKGVGGSASNFRKLGALTTGKYYDITIVVNEFVKSSMSSFAVTYDIAGSGVTSITETGTISFTILATTTDFTIDGIGGTSSDYIIIESIRINEHQEFNTSIGDIELDKSLLTLVNINSDEDVIQYCGVNLPTQIPCGKYYMVMSMEDATIFYSELITVKDFIPSQSPYTLIEWSNTCDLGDTIYQSLSGCAYVNRMYIDSELTKPEYPFKEEGEEDGEFKLNILFQKWEKKQSLMVASCPEFIVDALTGIRLHSTVMITKPIRKKQLQVLSAFEVEKVEYTNQSIFSDCSTNVELNILLKDKTVDSSCCSNVAMNECFECAYTVDALDTLTGDYLLGVPEEGEDFGLWKLVDEVYQLVSGTNIVVCVTDIDTKYFSTNGEIYYVVPSIDGVADNDLGAGAHEYTITGFIYPGTYCKVHAIIYDAVTSTTTTIDYTAIYTSAQLTTGIVIASSSFGVDVPDNGLVSFYVENFSLNCTYGISNTIDTIYTDLHAIIQDWRLSLVDPVTLDILWKLNNFIKGLDTDGILDEFDLLHVLAGLENDEQRLTPLISTSGNVFITSLAQDATGIQGDGSLYVDLAWQSTVDNVKMLAGDCSFGFYSNSDYNNAGIDMGYYDSVGANYAYIKSRHFNTCVMVANNSTGNSNAVTDSLGLHHAESIGTTINSYKNGVLLGSSIVASPSLISSNWKLANANYVSGSSTGSSRLFQFVFIGSSSVDKTKLYNRFMALKTALGF